MCSADSAGRNIASLPDLAVPDDTANLRQGPDLHPSLLALLPLVGVWRGVGEGNDPVSGDYSFGQQIVVSHDGGPYLRWDSRIWRVDADGAYLTADQREAGFWRIGADDVIELLIVHAEGAVDLFYGTPLTQTSWELATDVSFTTATGTGGVAAKRLYGLVDGGDFAYVEERVDPDGDLVPRLSARLSRYAG